MAVILPLKAKIKMNSQKLTFAWLYFAAEPVNYGIQPLAKETTQ
ncbi:hypothetical protein [Marinicella meishanensis]|nr:hypothetical protein [Marinicella sp. NBU2979]